MMSDQRRSLLSVEGRDKILSLHLFPDYTLKQKNRGQNIQAGPFFLMREMGLMFFFFCKSKTACQFSFSTCDPAWFMTSMLLKVIASHPLDRVWLVLVAGHVPVFVFSVFPQLCCAPVCVLCSLVLCLLSLHVLLYRACPTDKCVSTQHIPPTTRAWWQTTLRILL